MATSPIYSWPEPDNTDLVKNGALAIRTLGNAIDTTMATMTPKSLVDAKGDLVTATANDTPARLAVGANGEYLVADSTTATGLSYQANFAAGKNKIINGDFGIWQRGTSFVNNNNGFAADRWLQAASVANPTSWTVSQQTFNPGTAPVAGYEGTFFLRSTITTVGTATSVRIVQRIEDVRVFAGQTVTVSFWAKNDSTRNISTSLVQTFGSGGSSAVSTSGATTSIGTSWTRYTSTISVPTISGKTIGTNPYLELRIFQASIDGSVMDIWGVQVEAGSVATAFQTATGTLQGELALCQRYYAKSYAQATAPATNSSANGLVFAQSGATVANSTYFANVPLPVTMRANPTVTIYSFTSSQTARVSDGAGIDLAANSGATNLINDSRFTVQNNSGAALTAASGGFVFHYTVSAEL